MLKRIKVLFLSNVKYLAILTTISILILSLVKVSGVKSLEIKNVDKLYHSFAYFVLTVFWLFCYYKTPKRKYIIVVLCVVFGIIIEVLQNSLTVYRNGDLLDILANTFGVVLALFIFNLFLKKNEIN